MVSCKSAISACACSGTLCSLAPRVFTIRASPELTLCLRPVACRAQGDWSETVRFALATCPPCVRRELTPACGARARSEDAVVQGGGRVVAAAPVGAATADAAAKALWVLRKQLLRRGVGACAVGHTYLGEACVPGAGVASMRTSGGPAAAGRVGVRGCQVHDPRQPPRPGAARASRYAGNAYSRAAHRCRCQLVRAPRCLRLAVRTWHCCTAAMRRSWRAPRPPTPRVARSCRAASRRDTGCCVRAPLALNDAELR